MALPATDNFNRANGAIGSNWTTQSGTPEVRDNQGRSNDSLDTMAFWNADVFNADQYSQCDNPVVAAGASKGGPAVRASGTGGSRQMYLMQVASGSCGIFKYIGGFTNLGSINSYADGDSAKLEVSGTTLQAYKNGAANGSSVTDSALASGSAGLFLYDLDQQRVDNWEGGNLGAGGGAVARQAFALLLMGVN